MPEHPSQTVFVVDDEPAISSTLVAILNAFGFQATAFTKAENALVAAKSTEPSLLITDVGMPGMNGIDLAIQVKSMHPECRVMLFSGQAVSSDIRLAITAAGHDFELLIKPVHPRDLLAAIKRT
jgi:FixJ family two-component response regulator